MDEQKLRSELRSLSQVVLIFTVTFFSVFLVLLNRAMAWETWILPIFVIGTFVCWILHITGRATARIRTYIYAFLLIFELFYYIVNVESVYDSSSLIVVSLILFAMTEERMLVILDCFMSYLGMILNMIINDSFSSLKDDYPMMIRTGWEFAIILLAAVMVVRVIRAWNESESMYMNRIEEVIKENELANNFLANVSHEIRTPINAVMGLTTVLEAESLPPRIAENVEAIQAAGHRVADQISDILDFTEIDMHKLAVHEETYMVTSLINDLLNQMEFSERSDLELIINLEPSTPAELEGDPMKLKKILWHLISNGMKFTNTGGVYTHIYCNKREYGVNLVFEIIDTGIGMTEDEVDKIYMKYYQADTGRARAVGGLGLGIPIVNGFTECMGGFLSINSTVDEGTVIRVSIPQKVRSNEPGISVINKDSLCCAGFMGYEMIEEPRVREFYDQMIYDFISELNLPFHRVTSIEELKKLIASYRLTHLFVGPGEYLANKAFLDSLADEIVISVIGREENRKDCGKGITLIKKPLYGGSIANVLNSYFDEGKSLTNLGRLMFPGISALVVDDEPMNLMVAKGIFEGYGMEVDTAISGYEAIEMCDAGDYDIVFMDHMMPKMDGIEAMKRIRVSLSKLKKEIYMIALTANAISTAKDMFMAEGFDGFIPKPIEMTELERVLKHVLPRTSYTYEAETKESVRYKDLELLNYQSIEEAYSNADEALNSVLSGLGDQDKYKDLRSLGVDISMGLKYCKNDREFYDELLMEYASDRKGKEDALNTYLDKKDWEEYMIRVHGVKSTSKMIGAMSLYEKAKVLEDASKAKDEDTVRIKHPDFMPAYIRLMDMIASIFEEKDNADDDFEVLEFEAKEKA